MSLISAGSILLDTTFKEVKARAYKNVHRMQEIIVNHTEVLIRIIKLGWDWERPLTTGLKK
jgi:hypothetical protein